MTRDRLGCLYLLVVALAILFVGWLAVDQSWRPVPPTAAPTIAVVMVTVPVTETRSESEQVFSTPTTIPEPLLLTPARPTATATWTPAPTVAPTETPDATQKPAVQRG